MGVREGERATGIPGRFSFGKPATMAAHDQFDAADGDGDGDRMMRAAEKDGSPESLLDGSIAAAMQELSNADLEEDTQARHEHLRSARDHVNRAFGLSENITR